MRGDERLDITLEMMSLTMEIVAEALFSSDITNSIDELGRAVTTLIDVLGHAESARPPRFAGMVPTMAIAPHPFGARSARPDDL